MEINRKERKRNIDIILNIVKEKYPDYEWTDFFDIVYNQLDFCADIETIKENYDNIFDEDVEPELEISFESEDEVFCQVYVDEKYNINRMFLDID